MKFNKVNKLNKIQFLEGKTTKYMLHESEIKK